MRARRCAVGMGITAENDRILCQKVEQRRRDALLDAQIQFSARKQIDRFTKTSSELVDVESAVEETVREVTKRSRSMLQPIAIAVFVAAGSAALLQCSHQQHER
jgi:hypothetical protein